MRAKESFKFEHEVKKTKETKIPKSKVKFKRLQPKAVGQSKGTQTGIKDAAAVNSGYVLGEAPANTYSVNTHSPLVVQIPELISPSSVDSSIYQSTSTYSPLVVQIPDLVSPSSVDSSIYHSTSTYSPLVVQSPVQQVLNLPTPTTSIYPALSPTTSSSPILPLYPTVEPYNPIVFSSGSTPPPSSLQINTNIPRARPQLRIDTDVPRVRNPRAPTRTTPRSIDLSQITAANMVAGSRRRPPRR